MKQALSPYLIGIDDYRQAEEAIPFCLARISKDKTLKDEAQSVRGEHDRRRPSLSRTQNATTTHRALPFIIWWCTFYGYCERLYMLV